MHAWPFLHSPAVHFWRPWRRWPLSWEPLVLGGSRDPNPAPKPKVRLPFGQSKASDASGDCADANGMRHVRYPTKRSGHVVRSAVAAAARQAVPLRRCVWLRCSSTAALRCITASLLDCRRPHGALRPCGFWLECSARPRAWAAREAASLTARQALLRSAARAAGRTATTSKSGSCPPSASAP